MKKAIRTLDILSIVVLILVTLSFLIFFGLQGIPVPEQNSLSIGSELISSVFFLLVAVVSGSVLYLVNENTNRGAFILAIILWAFLTLVFVLGFGNIDFSIGEILWRVVAFVFPLIYVYMLKMKKWTMWFKISTWITALGALAFTIASLVNLVGSIAEGYSVIIPIILTLILGVVGVYLVYRLLKVH